MRLIKSYMIRSIEARQFDHNLGLLLACVETRREESLKKNAARES